MDEIQQQIRTDLERQFRQGYRMGFSLIACFFVLLIPYYLTEYPYPLGLRISGITAVAVVLLAGILAALSWDRIPPKHYQIMGALGMGVILLPVMAQLYLHGPWRLHVAVGLVMVINALIFHRLWYFLLSEIVTVGLWVGISLRFLDAADRINLGIAALSALVVSVAANTLMVGLLKNQAKLRIQDLTREREKERLLLALQTAFEQVKTLRGLVPICAQCKKVRDDMGYWQRVETFVEEHSHAEFTHGLCPECLEQLEKEFAEAMPAGD